MRQRGYTLIETLVVMTLLGIASVTIIALQGNIFTQQIDNRDLQTGVQLVQECAEQVLAIRRRAPGAGYAAINTSVCNSLNQQGGFGIPTLTLRDDTGASVQACSSSFCTVSISVGKLGSTVAPITLRLSNY